MTAGEDFGNERHGRPSTLHLTWARRPPAIGMPRYVRQPFQLEPDFGVTSVNYNLPDLLARTEEPA
jgi:hypothetical protein